MPIARPFSFKKHQHLRSSSDFTRIYDQKQRAGDNHLLIFAATNNVGQTRIGLSVSKKHGNAIRRSRIKRLLREAFRLNQYDLPAGLDLILIPRQGAYSTLTDYGESLRRITRRLAKRIAAR